MTGLKLSGRAALLACAAVTAVTMSGCNRSQTSASAPASLDALPLTQVSTPSVPAPTAASLPYAAPARIARVSAPGDRYAYLDRAYAMSRAYGDAPPDYAVDYQGERPWIWRGSDDSERVVERTPQGLRYFYYEPGADRPYLVQDPEGYSYGYSDGELTTVYGPGGVLEPDDVVDRRAAIAGRYLAWAAALQAASLRQQHQAVEQAHWEERRADIAAQRSAWEAQQSRQDAWAAYHQAHDAEQQAHWADESARRQAEAARYAQNPPGPPAPPPVFGYGSRPQERGPGQDAAAAAAAAASAALLQRQANQAADAAAYRRAAEQSHAAQTAAAQQAAAARDAQAAGIAQAQRQAALAQGRAEADAERRASAARNAQAAATAQAQREAALGQARAAADAQRRAAAGAHAAELQAEANRARQAAIPPRAPAPPREADRGFAVRPQTERVPPAGPRPGPPPAPPRAAAPEPAIHPQAEHGPPAGPRPAPPPPPRPASGEPHDHGHEGPNGERHRPPDPR